MAYNRENLLKRIIEIQDIVIAHQKRGVTMVWTFDNIIHPRFFISYSTFNNYMATNARRELARLYRQRIENEKQLTIKFEE